ncbi:hypothetical protein KKC44_02035 [Patescibacteria group bacterium]|nr:hypothetical protein [Patescibacteria group bacterium]MBU2259362.1 hypothetical protein [Patescibacteria group bacterium]
MEVNPWRRELGDGGKPVEEGSPVRRSPSKADEGGGGGGKPQESFWVPKSPKEKPKNETIWPIYCVNYIAPNPSMKRLHIPSYLIGLACGVAVLLLYFGFQKAFSPSSSEGFPQQGNWQQRTQGDDTRFPVVDDAARTQRMAETLGMTVEELEKELESGKTMMEIAEERGVEMPFGGGRRMRDSVPSEESGSGVVDSDTQQTETEEEQNVSEPEDIPPVPLP